MTNQENQCKWIRDDYHWKTQCGRIVDGSKTDPEVGFITCFCGSKVIDLEKAYSKILPAKQVSKTP